MNKRFFLIGLIFLLFNLNLCLFAQKYTVSGYITDKSSGEKLIGASIFDANTIQGVVSNNYGFYSLTLPEGKIRFTASFVGYTSYTKEILLDKDIVLNVQLNPSIELEEVKVVGDKIESQVESSQMGVIEIPVHSIQKLPVLFGETDVLKTIQLMPGVQSGTEGTSGIYVRGGGPDQNLILLDGVPVYNANHLFGFFSVFNGDAIQNVKLIKGGFPARYGGRLSSVIDIQMKEGNNQKIKGNAKIGLISSRLTLEGPLFNENTSFIISGRRTYIDILAQPFIKIAENGEDMDKMRLGYYFYDLNAKVNHKFSDKHRLYLSFYLGNDKAYANFAESDDYYSYEDNSKLRWGNITSAVRWNYLINKKLFCNTTLTYSRYKFLTSIEGNSEDYDINEKDEYALDYNSGIDDLALKTDFDFIPSPNHYIRFGTNMIFHTFHPGVNTFKYDSEGEKYSSKIGNKDISATEFCLYAEDDIKLTNRLKINTGLHYSGFYVDDKFYHSLEPRVSARLLVNSKWSVKASYAKMTQYIHLLTNTSVGLPTDLWLPVTDTIKPQHSIQYSIGSAYAITEKIDLSIEAFYKSMDNLIEYKDGATFMALGGDWESKVETGKGRSYGVELLVQKNVGNTTGWIGYTLSWAHRKFENISFGEEFPYRYDRRHDISIVVTHKFNDRIDIGATWVYGTGNALTLGVARYDALSDYDYYTDEIEYIEKRNSFRAPAYHRLDFGINFHKEKKRGTRTWSLGAYNVYNRKNPFFLRYDDFGSGKLEQVSLFPILPYFSYSFKF